MYIPKGYDKNLCLSHLKDIFNRYEIKILNKKVLCQFKWKSFFFLRNSWNYGVSYDKWCLVDIQIAGDILSR